MQQSSTVPFHHGLMQQNLPENAISLVISPNAVINGHPCRPPCALVDIGKGHIFIKQKTIHETLYGTLDLYTFGTVCSTPRTTHRKLREDDFIEISSREGHGEARMAVKRFDMSCVNSGTTTKRVKTAEDPMAELRMLRRVRHPHVVPLLCHTQDENQAFFILPYAEGGSLFEYLQQYTVSESHVRSLFAKIAGAVAHLHSIGIVHCDISPENIILKDDDHPWLIDFGMAEELEPMEGGARFNPLIPARGKGKLRYMSPECHQLGSRVGRPSYDGPKSDVWSFGVTAAVAAVGTCLWEIASPTDQIFGLCFTSNQMRPLFEHWQRRLSDEFYAFVNLALKVDPRERVTMLDLMQQSSWLRPPPTPTR